MSGDGDDIRAMHLSSPRALGEAAGGAGARRSYAAQFDILVESFDRVYPAFEYKGIDWPALHERYRARALAARTQDEFVSVAREMLSPLRDLHVWFVDPRGQVVPTYRPSRIVNFERARWQRALRDAGYAQRAPGIGEANVGGYGYLFLDSWKSPVDIAALDLTLARMRDLPGLIIDVRTNGGGLDATALTFVSRFATRRITASYVQHRIGDAPGTLGAPEARTVGGRGEWQYTKPVVIIAGRGGFSATETFVAAMRTLPQVIVLGDTTGGASGNPATVALGNGWQFTVPQWIEYGPDHEPIEWRGVAPQVPIAWQPFNYERDRDPLIDAAVGILAERNGVYRMAAPEREGGVREPTSREAPRDSTVRDSIMGDSTLHDVVHRERLPRDARPAARAASGRTR